MRAHHPSIRHLLTAALAVGALAPAAQAQEFFAFPSLQGDLYVVDGCGTPSLDQCGDPAFLETECGQQALQRRQAYPDGTASCFDRLAEQANERVAEFEHAVRLPPEGMEGEPAWTAVTPYTPEEAHHAVEGQAAYGDIVAGWQAQALMTGELSPVVREQLEREEAEGPAFETCGGYIRAKYAPLNRFEAATAAVALDARATANIGMEILGEGPLVSAEGLPLDEGEAMIADTPFLSAPLDVVAGDDRVAHLVDAVANAPQRPMTIAWHLAADRALAHELDEALEREAAHGRRFKQVVAAYEGARAEQARLQAVVWLDEGVACDGAPSDRFDGCDGRTYDLASWQDALEGAAGEAAAAHEAIVDGLLAAERRGCFARDGEISRCAWAPSTFAEDLNARFGAQREADFKRCREVEQEADGGLPGVRFMALTDIHGDVVLDGQDWLAAPSVFERFMQAKADNDARKKAEAEALQAAEDEKARKQAEAALSKLGGGAKKPEQRFHKRSELGDRQWNLYYEYLLRWRVFDFGRVLCNVNAEFEAMFRAGATALGKSFDLIYGRIFVNLHKYQGDLRIAGKSIYKDHRQLVGKLHFDLVKPTTKKKSAKASASAWFTIVFIPVKVEGGIAGTVGLKYGVKAGIDKGGAQCTKVDAYVKGHVTPFANVDGFASLAIELLVARAGIKGSLQILGLNLPVTAKVALSAPQGDIRKLELVTSASAKLTLKALSGALKLWGEAGWCPFCIKGEVPIFKWKGLSWSYDLFKTELKLPLLGAAQLFPNG